MGSNFPPGAHTVASSSWSALGLTGAVAPVVIQRILTPGMYSVECLLHIVSTDGQGSLAPVCSPPHRNPISFTPTLATPVDGIFGAQDFWANAGDEVTLQVTATGIVNTTYNLHIAFQQLL